MSRKTKKQLEAEIADLQNDRDVLRKQMHSGSHLTAQQAKTHSAILHIALTEGRPSTRVDMQSVLGWKPDYMIAKLLTLGLIRKASPPNFRGAFFWPLKDLEGRPVKIRVYVEDDDASTTQHDSDG